MEFPNDLLVTLSCRLKHSLLLTLCNNNPYQRLIGNHGCLPFNPHFFLHPFLPVFPPFHCSFCLERWLFTSISDDFLSNKRSTFLSSPARHSKHAENGRNQKVEGSERAGGRTVWCKKAPCALTPQSAVDDSATCLFSPLSTARERSLPELRCLVFYTLII